MMPTPLKETLTPRLKQAYKDMAEAMKAPADKHSLTSEEVLALLAYMVGTTIALQDQRTITPEMAMDLVIANLTAGNKHAVDDLLNKTAGSA